jgi:hypothetical protein
MIITNRIAAIYFLELEEDFTFCFFETLYASTDSKIIDNFFHPSDIISIIGHNEYSSIKDAGIFIYSGMEIKLNEEKFNERVFLINFLVLVELFCQSSWLVKDNAIQSELGHLVYQTNSSLKVHSNLWHSYYTNCIGKREKIIFSLKEIEETIKLMDVIFSVHYIGQELFNESVKVTQKISRLARAFYFVQSARNAADLGTKLAHYCSVFECIFSTSTTELRHRLSETIAFFLEKEYQNRIDIYRTLQMAYDIRSSVVHGDGVSSKFLKNEHDLLIQTAIKTDNILRRCLLKIIKDPILLDLFTEKTKDEVNIFIQGLVFNAPNT